MLIKILSPGVPILEDAENFKAFKVVSDLPASQTAAALAQIGRVDGLHVWVAASWLLANGPDDAGWRVGLGKMAEYAKSAGWVDEAGAIRAHIEAA